MKATNNLIVIKSFVLLCFALLLSASVSAQKTRITGEVVGDDHEPVVGATIWEIGSQNRTVTNADGKFSIEVGHNATLRFSYIGYATKEQRASNGMKVILKSEANMLNEVVAIGYGSVKRKDVTTAVSSVSTKDLESRPIVSATAGIQGKAAGIMVSQANGQPGSSPTIRVRGTTSMNGSNNPLYVVDGVPMTDVDFLSADDIDEIHILKDASSAAIYGSRAANGVIIINTKQGKAGITKVSLNAHYAFNTVRDDREPLNAAQYKELIKEMNERGVTKLNLPDNLKDCTDWKNEVYRVGNVQDYQLSVTSGTEKLRYFLGGGYTGENGVIGKSNFQRYNVRLSVENDIRPWLRLNGSVAYSDYVWKGVGIFSGNGSNRAGVVTAIINTPTYAPIWDPENPGQYYTSFYGVNMDHPLESLSRTQDNKTKYNKIIATGKATIKFLPELNFTTSLSLDRSNGVTTEFVNPFETHDGRDTKGSGKDERATNTLLIFDNVLNWKKNFGFHGFDAMAGSSWTSSKWDHSNISGTHYAKPDIKTLNAANKISWDGTGSSAANWAILSYFVRLQYNWNDTYMATFNMRADGSSKLAPGHRWGYFPSFSAAWRITNEKFMKNITWLNDLKLRGGWGQTGNQSGLGDYSYLAKYDIRRIQWFGTGNDENAVPTRVQATLSAPELTWETTSQTDIGLDVTMFNNRLTLYIDYYYKYTKDMLMTATLPAGSAAAKTLRYNGGAMENKGWEFTVSSKNFVGNFAWDTDFNISFNRNKLKKLTLTQKYPAASTSEVVSEDVVLNTPGRPMGSFYGYISDGVDPETGELMYRDVNEDGVVSISDRTFIGDPNPDFIFGMTNTFRWKGFNLSILLQGTVGNDVYNVSRMETEGMYDGKNQTTKVLNRWRIPGQQTDIPKVGFVQHNSTYYLENGSYLRVKDISLSYDVPRSIISKFGLTKLMPYVSATNLFTITKYSGLDPELNQHGNSGTVQGLDWGTYPLNRSFVMGVKVEF